MLGPGKFLESDGSALPKTTITLLVKDKNKGCQFDGHDDDEQLSRTCAKSN